MWRDHIRELLVLVGLIERPTFVARYVDRHPTPDQVRDGEIVIVRGQQQFKWACFRCPGGCGNRFQLSLNPSRRPRWSIRTDWLNRPTINPSVLQNGACGAHFWISRARVQWCTDTKCGPSRSRTSA